MDINPRSVRNLECERGVIAACLVDNERIPEVAALLRPDDFSMDAHGSIFGAILKRWNAGRPVDAMSLSTDMGAAYEAMGGDGTLLEIANSIPHAENARYHAEIVKEKAMVRGLILIVDEVKARTQAQEHSASELIDDAESKILRLLEHNTRIGAKGPERLANDSRDAYLSRKAGSVRGVTTGIREIDRMLVSMAPGRLYVLGARTGIGKTSFGLSVANYLAIRNTFPVLFLSMEMPSVDLTDRLASQLSGIDGKRIQTAQDLTPREDQHLNDAFDAIEAGRLWIEDSPRLTMPQIYALARMHRARNGLELLIVDYLGLIDGQPQRGDSRQEVVARISRGLKALAKEVGIPILALHQLNRESEKRTDNKPRMSDLRESGQVEQDADAVMLLHRPSKYDPGDRPGEADVIVEKHRHGPSGVARVAFHEATTRFCDLEYRGVSNGAAY